MDDDAALAHQQDLEHWQWLLEQDPGYRAWLDSLNTQTETDNLDMTKYAGSEGKYLKAEEIKGKNLPPVRISAVELVEFENEGKIESKPALAFVGKEKQVTCSPTNVKELIKAFGPNSESWIGKEVRLSTIFWPGVGKDGIVVTPITGTAEPGW